MKPLTFSILRLLSDNEFHSGETIAQGLGISRTSVSNALRGLQEAGVTVHKVNGRGYRLLDPVQWLQTDLILEHLGEDVAGNFSLEVVDIIGSTSSSAVAKDLAGTEFLQHPCSRGGGGVADKWTWTARAAMALGAG